MGRLLQEIKQDFELSRYSVVIIDEAHERTIYTDVLLGLISMVVRLRRRRYTDNVSTKGRVLVPLKLIIMSATLRVSDFSENHRLFPAPSKPPVIHVESRQFPVTCHFAKVTHSDYLKAAFHKVATIHRDSPPGGILVFVTGQREAVTLCSWLSRAFPINEQEPKSFKDALDVSVLNTSNLAEVENKLPESHTSVTTVSLTSHLSHINLDNFDIIPADEETELGPLRQCKASNSTEMPKNKAASDELGVEVLDHDSELEEVDDDDEILDLINQTRKEQIAAPIHALPLYSLLSPELQQRVFDPPPDGHRLVVVATNVAETSITIPDIRFVVDTGKVKKKIYDVATGASGFEIGWISQASAEQRAGRAGRVAPGHCYRLYSSQVFTNFAPFTSPDILSRPIDEVVLMLKSYLGTTPLSLFPLPTPPSSDSVEASQRRLIALGSLEETRSSSMGQLFNITRAGKWMSRLPVPVRFARMLLFANQHNLMPYAVILVAALSVPNIYMSENSETVKDSNPELEQFRTNFVQQFVRQRGDLYLGDLAVLLGTICCLERYASQLMGLCEPEPSIIQFYGGIKQISHDPDAALRLLVQRCNVRWNAYKEVRQLRRQLTDILNANVPGLNLTVNPNLPRPNHSQVTQLRQLFLVGSPCHIARKLDISILGLPAKERRRLRYAYEIPGKRGPVFIDPNSPLARENCPFVAYLELLTLSKPVLRIVCAVDPNWIPFLVPYSYVIEGLILSDEMGNSQNLANLEQTRHENSQHIVVEQDVITVEEEMTEDCSAKPCESLSLIPTPHYDATQDIVVTGAKSIKYIGSGVICQPESPDETSFLELPTSVSVPINCFASAKAIGNEEALMWSVRWFLRFLLEGLVFSELKPWFPTKIKKSLSPLLITVSWGIIRPEVRKLVSVLVSDKIDSRQSLLLKWKTDSYYLLHELSLWIRSDCSDAFHTSWPYVDISKTDT